MICCTQVFCAAAGAGAAVRSLQLAVGLQTGVARNNLGAKAKVPGLLLCYTTDCAFFIIIIVRAHGGGMGGGQPVYPGWHTRTPRWKYKYGKDMRHISSRGILLYHAFACHASAALLV